MIPTFDIRLDHGMSEPDEKLYELLGKVRPGWTKENVQVKRLRGGYVNAVWYCRVGDEKLAVRVHPDSDNPVLTMVDREFEMKVITVVAKEGLAQPLYARFANGMVCGYAEGDTCLNFKRVNEPEILQQIVEQLVALHRIPLAAVGAEDWDRTKNFWYNGLATQPSKMPEKFEEENLQEIYAREFGSRERVQRECVVAMAWMDELFDKYPRILAHNDIWYTNMVYDDATKTFRLIDWEMAGVANVPLEFALVTEDFKHDCGTTVEEEHACKRTWVEQYLRARDGRADSQDVDALTRDVIKATAAVRLGEGAFDAWHSQNLKDPKEKEDLMRRGGECFSRYLYYKQVIQEWS